MRVYTGSQWITATTSPDTVVERSFAATAGQTTYTFTGGYRVGFTYVWVNGVLLDPADITATDGTTITFTSALALNDEVRILTFKAVGSLVPTDIGATTVGSNFFTLTNPGAITFTRINADNTVSALSASDFRTAIGAGTSSTTGTVTSVAVSGGTTGLTTSGGPITSSGTITLAGTLAVANGGTGATTNTNARTNLGATTLGSNLFTITNPSAVTFPRFNADNTVSSLSASDFRTAIGAGTGNGTVTGVTATAPVASSGGTSPVISLNSAFGDTLNPYGSKTANNFLAAPNGTAGAPSFRAIVAADIPTLNQNTTGTAANVTGTVAIANGGTGATTNTNARTNLGATTVGSNLFTLTNPSAIRFLRVNADNTVSALSDSDFRTAIGAGTSSTTGTVTSVGGTGSVNGITLSGTVTSSGNLTLGGTLSGVSLSTQVTGTLPVANGGTGATDSGTARTNLGGTTAGQNFFTLTNPSAITFPRINANNTVSALSASDFRTAIGAGTGNGTVTSVATGTGLTGGPVTTSGTISLANTAVTPGNYTSADINVDAQGRITAASNGSGGGITMGKAVAAAIVFG